MAAPERENIPPLGEKVIVDLVKIDMDAGRAETVLALGDGLNIRPSVISEINEIVRKCTP